MQRLAYWFYDRSSNIGANLHTRATTGIANHGECKFCFLEGPVDFGR